PMPSPASSRTSTTHKPWSSGRILSPSQREAKRHNDRTTKRAKAEKQKDGLRDIQSQINHLQDLIHAHLGTKTRFLLTSTLCTLSRPLLEEGSYTILQLTNDILLQVRQVGTVDICTNERLNHDAIIRGVLGGWHTLRGMTYSCPLWKPLSQIDECIFMHSGVLTRLSMLTMIHTMLVAVIRNDSFACLPAWYRPRPTQMNFRHQLTADYFAWPGFRERLVVSDCEILTNRFFKGFASCFRLIWPYPISDIYEYDATSGLYLFSNTFQMHIRDIGMWTMCKEFFQNFPQLQDDMSVDTMEALVPAAPSTSVGVEPSFPSII
ncbi:DUF3425 domain-containing protein, partial [Aspergillus glaucus CBS 516.65]